MDENADLRLLIETARKSKNWARRCYAYELALEFFSISEPDCYELCSYGDFIPEFLDEKNEHCLVRALIAVKVYVNRCADAPMIAKTVTRIIVQKIFCSFSNRVLELASDIVIQFIELGAYDIVLKELIIGALKYDIPTAEICIQVMWHALKDFGPEIISINKLLDFVEILVEKNLYHDVLEECTRLLIQIYQWTGPQIRVHLVSLLEPEDLSLVEKGYGMVKNTPTFCSKFVRYHRENTLVAVESEEDVFATCAIAQHASQIPLENPKGLDADNEGIIAGVESTLLLGLGEYNYIDDIEREINEAILLIGVLGSENKNGDGLEDVNLEDRLLAVPPRNNEGALDCENITAYDMDDDSNINLAFYCDYGSELFDETENYFENLEDPLQEANHCNMASMFDVSCHSIRQEDKSCQTKTSSKEKKFNNFFRNERYFSKIPNPYEAIIMKLFDKYGTEDILLWLNRRLCPNSIQISQTHDKEGGDDKFDKLRPLQKIKQDVKREKTQIVVKNSFSDTAIYNLQRPNKCLCNFGDKFEFNHRHGLRASFPSLADEVMAKKECLRITNCFSELKQPLRIPSMPDDKTKTQKLSPYESRTSKEGFSLNHQNENYTAIRRQSSQLHSKKKNWISRFFKKFYSIRCERNVGQVQQRNGFWAKIFLNRFSRKISKLERRDSVLELKIHNELVFDSDCKPAVGLSSYSQCNLKVNRKNQPLKIDNQRHNLKSKSSTNKNTRGHKASKRTVFPEYNCRRGNASQSRSKPIQINVVSGLSSQLTEFESVDLSQSDVIPAVKKADSELMVCLSEDASVTEITPNLCCYCFQKNSVKRLNSKSSETNSNGMADGSSPPHCSTDRYEVEGSTLEPGKSMCRESLKKISLSLERSCNETLSFRHRGSGDQLSSQSLHNRQQVGEGEGPSVGEDGCDISAIKKKQKLCCCISISDGNNETYQIYT